MRQRRVRSRHKPSLESQRPFFEKKSAEGESFFTKTNAVHRKADIGHSSDPLEADADNAAQKVTSQQQVQKAEKKEEEKPVQKAAKQEEEKPVQRKIDPRLQTAKETSNDDGGHAPTFETLLAERKGRGFPLPDDIRIEMERKFGSNFRKVRIHNDPEASAMCETINAYAFAHGYDIYFQNGFYDPSSSDGKELLAHELAHIVQQNG
ncbi:MAG: DUF4157 domain-containing protein [Bacteroidota bacterium]